MKATQLEIFFNFLDKTRHWSTFKTFNNLLLRSPWSQQGLRFFLREISCFGVCIHGLFLEWPKETVCWNFLGSTTILHGYNLHNTSLLRAVSLLFALPLHDQICCSTWRSQNGLRYCWSTWSLVSLVKFIMPPLVSLANIWTEWRQLTWNRCVHWYRS